MSCELNGVEFGIYKKLTDDTLYKFLSRPHPRPKRYFADIDHHTPLDRLTIGERSNVDHLFLGIQDRRELYVRLTGIGKQTCKEEKKPLLGRGFLGIPLEFTRILSSSL